MVLDTVFFLYSHELKNDDDVFYQILTNLMFLIIKLDVRTNLMFSIKFLSDSNK